MIRIVKPSNPALQHYIDFFYFFTSDESEKWSHVAFPHINTGLSFFNRVSVDRKDFSVSIKESLSSDCCIEILGKYTKPVYVSCKGVIDEVAIVFRPLGVNRFIREDFVRAAANYSQPFNNEQWLAAAMGLFISDDRIAFLEEFLLSVLIEKEELVKMEQALAMLETNEVDYSVAEIADKLNSNLKTFQRNFTKMMACSPSDYKRIARFRNALRSKFQSDEIKTLTSITYEHNYTDQSYFIKEFRKLTNQNPKLFFKEVSQVGDDKIIWEIL